MIKIHKEIQQDYFLIELEGSRYFQIWNKWDLFENLLEANKKVTLYVEDTPFSEEKLNEIVDYIKQIKEEKNGKK